MSTQTVIAPASDWPSNTNSETQNPARMQLEKRHQQTSLSNSHNVCKTLQSGRLDETSRLMPSTIEAALEFPLVRDVEREIGREQLRRYIEFELIKLAQLVSVGGNLNDAQVQFISGQLVERYPNESIADFKLCFERGITFRYGRIYRLDPTIIFEWMGCYLEEKYQVVEEKLVKEKDEYYKVPERTENPDVADKYIRQMLESLRPEPVVSGMTEQEIKQEGQEKPKKQTYPSMPLSMHLERAVHDLWISECFDTYTAKPNENWMSEDKWREANSERIEQYKEAVKKKVFRL